MKTLAEDLKTGQFKHVYLLYGEEDYLRRQYAGRLRDALAVPGDDVNMTCFSGRDIDPGKVIDQAETMPFFAEHRVLFLVDTGMFKKGGEALADYVETIPGTTYLIFSETEVDRRSRLYKQVKKKGRAVEFARQSESVLLQWIAQRVKQEGKQITRPVAEHFLERTGNDMDLIDQELEKLFCYTMGRETIEEADIEAVCVNQTADRIFEMVDAIAGKQKERALSLYYDLLLLKVAPMRILFLITRHFRILLELTEMKERNYDRKKMASVAKVPEFAIRKYLAQAGKFSERQMHDAVRDGVQAEEDIKTGAMNDRLAVELYIVRTIK